MGKYSKKEFAEFCGVTPASVTKAVKSEKLILTTHEKKQVIDTEIPQNREQMEEWRDRNNIQGPEPELKTEMSAKQKLDLRKAEVDLELKEAELDKVRLQKQKLLGESIPTSLVSNLFVSLGSSFQNNYRSQSENLLNELFHRAKVDPAIAAEFRGKLIDTLNIAHEEAINSVKNGLKNIVEDESRKVK